MGYSIVDIKSMGDALRNTGYKDIESAVAEIVDNSIEAKANNIFIILNESINPKSGKKQVSEIAFLDNGEGMNDSVLGKCLGIGATTRKGRKGMGRFGVGLPQASLYACPKVCVYSWQNGFDNAKSVVLDIDEVKKGNQTQIDDPVNSNIPEKYLKYISYKTPGGEFDFSHSGTLVIWKNCDRGVPKNRTTLVRKLEFSLGQKFRYFIYDDDVDIKIISEEDQDNTCTVFPNDPLFLMTKNYVLGKPDSPGEPQIKMNDKNCEPVFELFTDDGIGTGEVNVPIKYEDKEGNLKTSNVVVRFSIVKSQYYDESAFPSIDPGKSKFGKKYAKKMEGISVVRAKREIDFREFDFYSNLNQPQHRWWGCEILFSPELDEVFGVANNKQYVELKEVDEDDIYEDDEIQPIWVKLYEIINPTIKAMYDKNKEKRKSTRSDTDIDRHVDLATGIINVVENIEDDDPKPDEYTTSDIEKGTQELIDSGIDDTTQEQLKVLLKNKVNFCYKERSPYSCAFDHKEVLDTILITINTSHKFYSEFLMKLYEDTNAKTIFELLLGSFFVSVKKTNIYQSSQNDKLISMWYRKLNSYIEEQVEPKLTNT